MTQLEMYAHHGSFSFGFIEHLSPDRLREVLQGATPTREELLRVSEAMVGMPTHEVPGLAAEIGMTADQITRRPIELCDEPPGLRF